MQLFCEPEFWSLFSICYSHCSELVLKIGSHDGAISDDDDDCFEYVNHLHTLNNF